MGYWLVLVGCCCLYLLWRCLLVCRLVCCVVSLVSLLLGLGVGNCGGLYLALL